MSNNGTRGGSDMSVSHVLLELLVSVLGSILGALILQMLEG